MAKIKAKFVTEITVIDTDSNSPVEVAIYKLATGGMIGIDSSFLEDTEDDVFSPFDKNVKLDLVD